MDEGENIEQALIREAREELGITPKSFKQLKAASYVGKNGTEVIPFLIKDWEGEIPERVLDQGNPLIWVDLDELLNSPLPHIKNIIQSI